MNTAAREAVATSVPFTPPVSSRARADRWWAARLTQKGGRRGSFTLRPAPLPSRSGAITPFPVSAGAAVHPKDMRRPPFSSPPTPRAAAAGSPTAPAPGPVHSLGRRDVHFALERALLTAHLECKTHLSNAECTSRRAQDRPAPAVVARPAALAHDHARPCTTPGGKALIFVTHNARTRMFIGNIPPGVVLMIEEPAMFFTFIGAGALAARETTRARRPRCRAGSRCRTAP